MDALEKKIEKQLIVRMYEPDMAILKETAKQISQMESVKLNLYGQCGEVLVVVTVHAIAEAAAVELSEAVAERFEQALGDSVYGRGKGSLAYFAAGEMIEHESLVAASDPKTGALLAEEFSHTRRGSSVFDFGDSSYNDARVMAKIKQEVAKKCAGGANAAQAAAVRAEAAAKCSRADVGVSAVPTEQGVFVGVYYKGYVYVRQMEPGKDAGKRAALAALDIVRRLMCRMPVTNARTFKAGSDLDWEHPVEKKPENPYLVPVIILAVLLIALGAACWYFFTTFSLAGTQDGIPMSSSQSIAVPAASDTTGTSSAAQSPSSGAASDVPASQSTSTVTESAQTSSQTTQPQADANGEIHPFA